MRFLDRILTFGKAGKGSDREESRYFCMSRQFDKRTAEDFGLIPSEEPDVFLRRRDNSRWKAIQLYDFGWGRENGYYRLPMPGFDGLVSIARNAQTDADRYGAAAVLLDRHCDELLQKCQSVLADSRTAKQYISFFTLLELQTPVNRSSILGKTEAEIAADYRQWKQIAEQINRLI